MITAEDFRRSHHKEEDDLEQIGVMTTTTPLPPEKSDDGWVKTVFGGIN